MNDKLSEANNHLSISLFKQLAESNNETNDVFSPISISTAFGMLHLGSRAESVKELRKVLGYEHAGLSDENVMQSFKSVIDLLCDQSKVDAYQFNLANRILAQNDFPILDKYKQNLRDYYNADITLVDFEREGEKAANEVNDWVKKQTKNKIEKLIEKPLDPRTRVILVNAVYFKGNN
jgi:serine protease inhibitor